MMLGINKDIGLVYEGRTMYGHAVWPNPVVCPANIVDESSEQLLTINKHDISTYVFKEVSYDMKSRLRRGQLFWKSDFQQPSNWHVTQHPGIPNERMNKNGTIEKQLLTYTSIDYYAHIKNKKIENPLILIGSQESYTIWSIIVVETTISGNQLLTLRSRLIIGALPNINFVAIPENGREHVIKFLEILSDEINSAGPSSIIDRSRETLSAIVSTYLIDLGVKDGGEDLAVLAALLEKNHADKVVIYSLSRAIARLHSRGKSSEQRKRLELRELHERDAELAVQCVGTVLCDLGWAFW